MNTHENWKKVEGFDNYSVSDLGNLRNDKTGRIFNGYKEGTADMVKSLQLIDTNPMVYAKLSKTAIR